MESVKAFINAARQYSREQVLRIHENEELMRMTNGLAERFHETAEGESEPLSSHVEVVRELHSIPHLLHPTLNSAVSKLMARITADDWRVKRISDYDYVQKMYEKFNGMTQEEIEDAYDKDYDMMCKMLIQVQLWEALLKRKRVTSEGRQQVKEARKVYHCMHPELRDVVQRANAHVDAIAFQFPACQLLYDELHTLSRDTIVEMYDEIPIVDAHRQLLELVLTETKNEALVSELLSIEHLLHPDTVAILRQ